MAKKAKASKSAKDTTKAKNAETKNAEVAKVDVKAPTKVHKAHDTSPASHDPVTQSATDYSFRASLERYFAESVGSNTEKLENFTKFVPRQNLARFMARYEIFKKVLDVQGSIVECGVFYGVGLMAFAQLSTILEPYNFQRRIIGFDTFDGFPSIAEEDLQGLQERKSGHLHEGGFRVQGAYEDLQRAIELYDMNRFLNHFPKVQLVKGDFAKTSKQFLLDHPHLIVSCLYLDFDIYEPTRIALEQFAPRVPKGGIIVFDELNEEAFPGETTAVLEKFNLSTLAVRRFPFEPRISYVVVGE
ncbi:MAG: class I SAM-dependent methyltransferase [Candidatus Kapaibacterium sp.]|nr:MAG: class I SAM-dependent methyltransferase [Candidatus Kapabacteria bacterium]